ncbi:MAG: PD40 domain-containing protein, partial [Anaerolineales bacterium]|nr:PD40 domain-containing protein [Anaerolineales bacterium]
MYKRPLFYIALVIFLLACNLPSNEPNPNLLATLQASTPLAGFTAAPSLSTPSDSTEPTGKIAFTCQIFKDVEKEQICIVNADGSGYRRLTTNNDIRHYYPSVAPEGQSLLYSAYNKQTEHYEIYELDLLTNETKMLTYDFGDLNAPEISPDGKTIVFTRYYLDVNKPTSWLMDRDGTNLRQVIDVQAWDPSWSPDGSAILFATLFDNRSQLAIVNVDGTDLHQVGYFPLLRGRSDWSIHD